MKKKKKTESQSEVIIHILIAEALLNLPNCSRRFLDVFLYVVELAISILGGKLKWIRAMCLRWFVRARRRTCFLIAIRRRRNRQDRFLLVFLLKISVCFQSLINVFQLWTTNSLRGECMINPDYIRHFLALSFSYLGKWKNDRLTWYQFGRWILASAVNRWCGIGIGGHSQTMAWYCAYSQMCLSRNRQRVRWFVKRRCCFVSAVACESRDRSLQGTEDDTRGTVSLVTWFSPRDTVEWLIRIGRWLEHAHECLEQVDTLMIFLL